MAAVESKNHKYFWSFRLQEGKQNNLQRLQLQSPKEALDTNRARPAKWAHSWFEKITPRFERREKQKRNFNWPSFKHIIKLASALDRKSRERQQRQLLSYALWREVHSPERSRQRNFRISDQSYRHERVQSQEQKHLQVDRGVEYATQLEQSITRSLEFCCDKKSFLRSKIWAERTDHSGRDKGKQPLW